jgi:hypothetical protein
MIMKITGSRSLSVLSVAIFFCLFLLVSCSTIYYSAWEKLGKHKRDLLKDNVEAVKEEQIEAREEFKSALERLKELTDFDGGDLEDMYNRLKDDYDSCRERADAITDRIDNINEIAADLFSEWEKEIDSMSNRAMKRKDRARLQETKRRFSRFARAMEKAEGRLEPVLVSLNDQVLYLKHNLNARAVAGLKGEVTDIETDVNSLIRDMSASIAEADAFIKNMEK